MRISDWSSDVCSSDLLAHALEELHRIEFVLATILALRVERRAQEIGVVDTGDFNRVLERHEHPFAGTLFRRQRQQILALEADAAGGNLLALAAGQPIAELR